MLTEHTLVRLSRHSPPEADWLWTGIIQKVEFDDGTVWYQISFVDGSLMWYLEHEVEEVSFVEWANAKRTFLRSQGYRQESLGEVLMALLFDQYGHV